jgi:nucleotide-binding universal stress UspA family protein
MYRSILVPLDGSPFGEHALPFALSLARRAGARVHLVHVHTPLRALYAEGAPYIDSDVERHLLEGQRDYLINAVKRVETGDVPLSTDLLEGAVVDSIRAAAVANSADLVVMTTHGRGPMARFWLGSVADALVRDLPMPLLLVRPGEGAPDLKRDWNPRHILLPLDGSPLAEQIVEPAAQLAGLMGAEVTLLRVVAPVMPVSYHVEGIGVGHVAATMVEQIDQMQTAVRKEAEGYLAGVAARLRARSVKVTTKVDAELRPAEGILKEAPSFDLVALETHGRRGLSRLFLGSVADKVVRGSPVPVLVHRPVYA